MRNSISIRSIRLGTVALVLIGCSVLADIGGQGRSGQGYSGTLPIPVTGSGDRSGGECRFSVHLDSVMFPLNSVRGKYKIVRVRVENASTQAIKLSRSKDRISLVLERVSVQAILDLATQDTDFWDWLDESTRTKLRYPKRIEAGATRQANARIEPSVTDLFFLFPAEGVTRLPKEFVYYIESMDKDVVIGQPKKKAKTRD